MQAITKGCKGQPGQGLSVNVIILCQPLSVSLSGPLSLSLSQRQDDEKGKMISRGGRRVAEAHYY